MAYFNQNRRRFVNRHGTTNYRRPNYQSEENQARTAGEKQTVRYPGLPRFVQSLEPHIVRMIRILHANADIRRYTALGIVSRLISNKTITEEGNYIRFRWDKFTVCSKGINNDHRYTEKLFLESFVGAFSILATVASKALDNFCKCEFDKMTGEIVNGEEVDKASEHIIQHQLESDENIAQFEEGNAPTE